MSMCRNWRTWAVLAAVAIGLALAAPGLRATALPLLVVAACPLSMLVMGLGMGRAGQSRDRHDSDERRVGAVGSREGIVR